VPVELTKKGADADKQIELVEEALGEVMAARREDPFYEAPGGWRPTAWALPACCSAACP